MCGIAGIITKSGEIDFLPTLSKMLNVLRHRGPDHTNMRILNNKAYLGFNRLSIVDLTEKGNQPLFNEDNTVAIILNGEIYNYIELRERLSLLGHKFVSHSDAETVVHAYEEWGQECINQLRGMFAFAIWNTKTEELFLARDRFGIKPLYYLEHNKTFVFASELKAFTALPRQFWMANLNEEIVNLYFSFPFIMDNVNTLIKGVKKLPPGHIALFKDGRFITKRYWKLKKKINEKLNFEEAKEETEKIIKEAIECHLIGDVPIALMLTGGLDSSVMASLALQCNKRVEFALTVGHSNFIFDERKYGRLVANHLSIKHIELEINPEEVSDNIEQIVWYFDDLSSFSFFYQIYLAKKVRELGIKVVLIGQGADEIFGGYHIFKLSTFPFSVLPSRIWNILYYKMLSGKKFGLEYFKYTNLIKKGIFHPGLDVHNICSQFEIENQLPNYNLMAEDRGYMSHSVEARVPYLDHKVVEWVYSLPQDYKLKGFFYSKSHKVIKHILRQIGSKYLPEEIFNRRKQGLGLSISDIIRSNENKARDYILSANSMARMLFDKKTIESALEDKTKNLFFLSRLYVFEIWSKHYLSYNV